MLDPRCCRDRLERLRERLETPLDAIVLHRPEHLLYFGNAFPQPASLDLHSVSFVLAERDGPVTLFTDNWLAPGTNAAVDRVEAVTWYDFKRPARPRAQCVAERLAQRLRGLRVKRLGAELSYLPVHVAGAVDSVVDVEPFVRNLREVKDPDEIEAIRAAIRVAEAFHAASRDALRAGLTEMQLYARLLEGATRDAPEPFVMMCDLVSGPRAANVCGPPTGRRLHHGELVIVDAFPYVSGYRGDIANTLVVGGEPSRAQADAFRVVSAALDAGASLLAAGVAVRDVFDTVDATLRGAGYAPLPHHAGHAIGLGHPEPPEIVPESDALLEAGMVVTLEPGVYDVSGGGIRLEHDYLVTAKGCERLSGHALGLA